MNCEVPKIAGVFEKMYKKEQVFTKQQQENAVLHYNNNWEIGNFITQQNLSFYEGNIIKYVCRHKSKNGVDDLMKARNYLDKLIEEYK